MKTLARVDIFLPLICALALVSCANQPQPPPGKKMKLETIQRPYGPTTYLYREVDDSSH